MSKANKRIFKLGLLQVFALSVFCVFSSCCGDDDINPIHGSWRVVNIISSECNSLNDNQILSYNERACVDPNEQCIFASLTFSTDGTVATSTSEATPPDPEIYLEAEVNYFLFENNRLRICEDKLFPNDDDECQISAIVEFEDEIMVWILPKEETGDDCRIEWRLRRF